MAIPQANVVVGLDFGTTYSGYCYTHRSEPDRRFVHYDWPECWKPYCKTRTALYYKRDADGDLELDSWGWKAVNNYKRQLEEAPRSRLDAPGGSVGALVPLVTNFKLHLADKEKGPSSARELPRGLTVRRAITDFLKQIGEYIIKELQIRYGEIFSKDSIQWCVTVPAMWDDKAKQHMRTYMRDAGLVGISNPYPVIVVLEPEAAAVYCLEKVAGQNLSKGDRFLVADIGGGTADIVIQEKANSSGTLKLREVTHSGGLCGGTYVDVAFINFLSQKVKCLKDFFKLHPTAELQILRWWEEAKTAFDGSPAFRDVLPVSRKLSDAWEKYDKEWHQSKPPEAYDDVEIDCDDLQRIFDSVVQQNIDLIADQLSRIPNVKKIMVVGGFSGSKYLVRRIQERFSDKEVVFPPEPGRAVCEGAVALGMNAGIVVSRIARKTYGIIATRPFEAGRDPEAFATTVDGVKKCMKTFKIFVQKGDQVELDHCKENTFHPLYHNQKFISFGVYSSTEVCPRYTTGDQVEQIGEFSVDISKTGLFDARGKNREVKVSMYFGRTIIDVQAQGVNFGKHRIHKLPVEFEATES